jgi:hypothetical protein
MHPQHTAPRWFEQAWHDQIQTEYFVPGRSYSTDTVFYYDLYGPFQDHVVPQLTAGHRVIYDAKNEHYLNPDRLWILQAFQRCPGQGMFVISGHAPDQINGVEIAATPYWFWISDQQNFLDYGYDCYVPAPQHQYKFFMQMNLQRPERDQLFDQIQPIRHLGLCSYRDRGVHLPSDQDTGTNWQRYMNWDWVNAASITLVVESCLDDHKATGVSITRNNNKWITEKTYKPMAYGHAFLLAGVRGNLAHVREQGFETFPELWDESYDDVPHIIRRVAHMIKIIQQFDPESLNQPQVQQKIRHNRERFFDRKLTAQLQKQTIIDPVLRFANA